MDIYQSVPAPPLGRMMVFVDGENLVFRYQELLEKGMVPKNDVAHEKDIFVWAPRTVRPAWNVVTRAVYYTYSTGDEKRVQEIRKKVKKLRFEQCPYINHGRFYVDIPRNLTPCVFRKKRGQKAKGVDIQMTVDILSHVYQNNLDVVYLVSGDGDYFPVVQEAIRFGKQVYLAAFSSGLNDNLVNMADRFIMLDPVYFENYNQLNTK